MAQMRIRCPKCESDETPILVVVTAFFVLTNENGIAVGELYGRSVPLTTNLKALCNKSGCGWEGTVGELLADGR
jgi:hypothetical protein